MPAPAAARLAAMQMQALHKQPVKLCTGSPSSLPTCRQVKAEWPSSACLHPEKMIKQLYRQHRVALLIKNNRQEASK